MKKLMILMVSLLIVAGTAHANVLSNASFETGNYGWFGDMGFSIPDWDIRAVGGEPGAGSSGYYMGDAGTVHSGEDAVKMWYDDTALSQDFTATAGEDYVLGVWAKTLASDDIQGWNGLVKVEWYDGSDSLISASDIGYLYGDGVDPVDTWKNISATEIAPASVAYGSLVLTLERTGEDPGSGGSVCYDDASVIPEPATMTLLGLGSGLLLGIRRKK